MYAAGRLEAMNVSQYIDARNHARALGLGEFVIAFDAMVSEEARHEAFFGGECRGHFLLRFAARVGGWTPADVVEAPAPGT